MLLSLLTIDKILDTITMVFLHFAITAMTTLLLLLAMYILVAIIDLDF